MAESEDLRVQTETGKYDDALKEIVKVLRKGHFTYSQTKFLFKRARQELELRLPKETIKVIRHLSQEEAELLVDYSYRQRNDYGLLVKSLLFTGCRINEFVNIKIEDCLFSDNKILIRKGKGSKERYVPLFPFLQQELRTHIGSRRVGYLFESRLNKNYSTRRIQQIVKDIAKRSGIEKRVHPHLLRHTIATFLLNKGITLDQLQLFLGHSDIKTTQIYAKTSIEKLGLDYNKVIAGLLPKTYGLVEHEQN